ncbi:MAG: fibronectin type III domain-containing protein [Candidatus Paceibacterota bacterium]|jgi:hypothetical protein
MIKKFFIAIITILLVPFMFSFASEVTGDMSSGLNSGMDGVNMATVTASPAAGTYTSAQSITLTATGSLGICYTTNGTTPACASAGTSCTTGTYYSSAVSVGQSLTLKAISCYANGNSPAVASHSYTINITSGGGGGGGGATMTVPSLTNISIAPDTNSVVVSWTTNIVATSRVEYGLTSNLGQNVTVSTYIASHSMTITGLTPATTYYYIIKSVSSDGGMGYTTTKTFTTLAEKQLLPGSGTIGGSGGTVTGTTETGAIAKVTVPAGAVSSDTVFTVTPIGSSGSGTGNPPTGSFMVGNYVYGFTATGITTFSSPVTLTFIYTDAQVSGLNEATLKVNYWDGSKWVELATTVDSISNTLTVTVTHFTNFAIFGQKATVTTSNAALIAQLQAQLAQLQALLLQLLAAQGGTSAITGIPATFTFTKYLYIGKTGTDVKYLQIVLNSDANTRVSVSGAGSPGKETTVFGNATRAALLKFQNKSGIAGGPGATGPLTRAKLNALLGK